jgi:hypothetical protein
MPASFARQKTIPGNCHNRFELSGTTVQRSRPCFRCWRKTLFGLARQEKGPLAGSPMVMSWQASRVTLSRCMTVTLSTTIGICWPAWSIRLQTQLATGVVSADSRRPQGDQWRARTDKPQVRSGKCHLTIVTFLCLGHTTQFMLPTYSTSRTNRREKHRPPACDHAVLVVCVGCGVLSENGNGARSGECEYGCLKSGSNVIASLGRFDVVDIVQIADPKEVEKAVMITSALMHIRRPKHWLAHPGRNSLTCCRTPEHLH